MAVDITIREPGTLVDGRYKLERVLGRGGMGAVYEATQQPLGRRVALKMLHSKFTTKDSDVIRRFHQEAQLAASIGHDNICEVTDLGTDADGSPYLVMPLLNGCPMNTLMKEQNLSLSRIIPMFSQILSGLQAAHSARIVHRDLKPANIYVCKVGPHNDFVKLLDFGISKVLDQDTVTHLTRTGEILGTPHYMSPEQAMDPKKVDNRSDIYAVGVILYEAVLQRLPFEGKSYAEVLYKIISEPIPPPREIMPSLPECMESIIIKAMARHREDRFEHAAQFQTALEQCLKEIRRGSYDPGPPPDLADSQARVSTGLDMHQATTRHPTPFAARTDDAGSPPTKKSGVTKIVLSFCVLLALGAAAAAAFLILQKKPEPSAPVIPAAMEPLPAIPSSSDKGPQAAQAKVDGADSAPRLQLLDPIEPVTQKNSDNHNIDDGDDPPRRPRANDEHRGDASFARSSRKQKNSNKKEDKTGSQTADKNEDIYQNPIDVW